MDKAGLLEFNPYEKNTDNLPTCVAPITYCSGSGLSVLIQKNEKEDGKNVYYLLGHLLEYASDIKIGSIVYPGKVIGTVGNTGNCYTNNHKITSEERAEGKGSHLHLGFYKTEATFNDLYDKEIKNYITIKCGLVNPFLHVEIRNVDK